MSHNNLNEIAILNEELQYKPKMKFGKEPNKVKLENMAKKIIFQRYNKVNDDSKLDENVIKNTNASLNKLVKNDLNKVQDYSEIKLTHEYKNKNEVKGLKKEIRYHEMAFNMNIVLTKELKSLNEDKVKINDKLNKLNTDRDTNLNRKLIERYEIKLAKNKIRTKDVTGFIKNGTTYKKIYLSDEPPLNAVGWLKLFLTYGILLFWTLIIIWPLYELVKATTNDSASTYLDAGNYKFGLSSFSRLFNDTDYIKWMKNTLVVAGITSALTVIFALLMGYAFSRFRFKGKKTSLMSVMILQMIPTMASLTVFYVLYSILNKELQMSGRTVLILIYVGGGVAGNTFIMKGYMDSISKEIDEAAKIDGLSQWRIFTRIIVPLTKPMIALVALWSFIGPFGDYILPGLLLYKSEDYTLAKGLFSLITDSTKIDQAAFAAGAVIVSVPISLLFIALRNFLVGGITAGGVKG